MPIEAVVDELGAGLELIGILIPPRLFQELHAARGYALATTCHDLRTPFAILSDMMLFEPYEPQRRSGEEPGLPSGLVIRTALQSDAPAIAKLMAEREGGDAQTFLEKLAREFERQDLGERRILFVACSQGAVVAFARVAYCVPAANAPSNNAPEGWYLGGVIVAKSHRRRGIGRELTQRRLNWLLERKSTTAWYVVNAENRASIALHEQFGFREVTRDFVQPGVSFSGDGIGILFRLDLQDG